VKISLYFVEKIFLLIKIWSSPPWVKFKSYFMKIKELKQKSENELQKMLQESREKLREFRFKIASKQLKKVREVRSGKKLIAKILTLLNVKK
jgi:large subunit ribosomal protein L29